jgi:hypothetical protein
MPMHNDNNGELARSIENLSISNEAEGASETRYIPPASKLSSILVNDYFKNSPMPMSADQLKEMYVEVQKSPLNSPYQQNDMQLSVVFETEPAEGGFNLVHVRHKRRQIQKQEEKEMEVVDLDALEDLISKNDPSLKKIILRNKNLDSDDVEFLCAALRKNNVVTELDISDNMQITDSCTNALCKLISNNRMLKRLYLDGTSIRVLDEVIESLSKNMYIIDMILPDHARPEENDMVERYLVRNESF